MPRPEKLDLLAKYFNTSVDHFFIGLDDEFAEDNNGVVYPIYDYIPANVDINEIPEERVVKYETVLLTKYKEKFGIPRQSGLAESTCGEIIFTPKFRNPDAVRGIEEFSHLWLLWEFSRAKQDTFHATVAPPRLGGKEKRGVFATRSPFRPNSIGLSCVKLEKVRIDQKLGPVLTVSGLDLLDHTPLFDIKPYLPYVDAHPEAKNGFAEEFLEFQIPVVFPEELQAQIPEHLRGPLLEVLAQDPRAAYNKKPDYIYGMAFDDYDIRFTVAEGILTVKEVTRRTQEWKKVK